MSETKKEKKTPKKLATMVKMAIGAGFVIVGLLATAIWWGNLLKVLSGCIGPFLILVGAITIAIAKE